MVNKWLWENSRYFEWCLINTLKKTYRKQVKVYNIMVIASVWENMTCYLFVFVILIGKLLKILILSMIFNPNEITNFIPILPNLYKLYKTPLGFVIFIEVR